MLLAQFNLPANSVAQMNTNRYKGLSIFPRNMMTAVVCRKILIQVCNSHPSVYSNWNAAHERTWCECTEPSPCQDCWAGALTQSLKCPPRSTTTTNCRLCNTMTTATLTKTFNATGATQPVSRSVFFCLVTHLSIYQSTMSNHCYHTATVRLRGVLRISTFGWAWNEWPNATRFDARRTESGVRFLGGQPAHSPPTRGSGEHCKQFHHIWSTQEDLSWHFSGVIVTEDRKS